MTDDIVTRLRNNFANKDYPMLKDHCHSCAIPKEWGGHHDNCLYDQAADEIERLRALLDNTLERENKDNARQLQIVRKVEADRDRWKALAIHNDNLAQIQAGIYPVIPHYEEK